MSEQENLLEQAVTEGGAYEVIAKRLHDQGKELQRAVDTLNQQRIDEFGQTGLEVLHRVRVRTENNCIPRDIIRVNNLILLGYNVHIGLKNKTSVHDVFNLYMLENTDQGLEINEVSHQGTFLDDEKFSQQFQELYTYYKDTELLQLYREKNRFFAVFRIGQKLSDIRVFRWHIKTDGTVEYIDDRGERDIPHLQQYDFKWQSTVREDHVNGRYPHINILDTLFVEATRGDLTIKIENNTDTGEGIYSEPVDERNQSLSDLDLAYARLGGLILLRVRPYREQSYRYLLFNLRNQEVRRIDAIGQSCVQLLEDHGIIYPGGYYLQTGESKTFDANTGGMTFLRMIKSPNGEDALYVFYEPLEGRIGLFAYNLVHKELQNPIYCHGMARFDDGRFLLFEYDTNSEPTRVHPMQIWQTPFFSDEYDANRQTRQTFLGRLGNAEVVRGISDLFTLIRMINNQSPSLANYEIIIKTCQQLLDSYFWLGDQQADGIAADLKQIARTAELVLDEFEKVQNIQARARQALDDAQQQQKQLLKELTLEDRTTPQAYVDVINRLRQQGGHLISIREYRYIDQLQIDAMAEEIEKAQQKTARQTIEFLSRDDALSGYDQELDELSTAIESVTTVHEIEPLLEKLAGLTQGLDLLTQILGSLQVKEVTLRTRILEAISEVYSRANQIKANAGHKRKSLGSSEAVAEFSAQFKLFAQSVNNALNLVETPEQCDEHLSRLMVQLEDLESRFSEYDEFLNDILVKREEVQETFDARRQQLQDARNRRIQNLYQAARRILNSISRRTSSFTETDAINTYFASDPMPRKVIEISQQLIELGDTVKADEIQGSLKTAKQQGLRGLRDKQEIYEDGGQLIKLGQHRFTVNTQAIDVTLLPDDDVMKLHVTGTDFMQEVNIPELQALQPYWHQSLVSETPSIYRAEYLAWSLYNAIEAGKLDTDMAAVKKLLADENKILDLIRDYAQPRYQEGYEKGIHDLDCAKILSAFITMHEKAGILRFSPAVRAKAVNYWANTEQPVQMSLLERARNAKQLIAHFSSYEAHAQTVTMIEEKISAFYQQQEFDITASQLAQAARYLTDTIASDDRVTATDNIVFDVTDDAVTLYERFKKHLQNKHLDAEFSQIIQGEHSGLKERLSILVSWIRAFCQSLDKPSLERFIDEAAAVFLYQQQLVFQAQKVQLEKLIGPLMGEHPTIVQRELHFVLDDYIDRLTRYLQTETAQFHLYQSLRQEYVEQQRQRLNLSQYAAKPISSFVRNRLINEVYLPIIGANLAKQIGAAGDAKRTDLMGLLLLISPPGYGKTTLMEYIANRLGLVFMKINCPSIGHQVLSLDPEEAHNATSRQELIKLNFALEMGNNVMLYLDDIQHTNPEFLQKFISLCDATRRIEGVWEGQTRTYDMRGKKFCVIMAGNPYTESGEAFKIPDMLANRADIYNLGDILSGAEEAFESSYVENALTSNAVLAPLANRDMADLYLLMRMARGENIPGTDLQHDYSSTEINELMAVLKRLYSVQEVVLKINQQYIQSAAKQDKYRTEPPFKLQGSYRNMNKMAEKVNAVMNDEELQALIHDHYVGEAQTLTTGAEENLLKLAEIRGMLTDDEAKRWATMKREFVRINSLGGDDADGVTRIASQMASIANRLSEIGETVGGETLLSQQLKQLNHSISAMQKSVAEAQLQVNVTNEPIIGVSEMFSKMGNLFETSFLPVFHAMHHKLALDHDIWEQVQRLADEVKTLGNKVNEKKTATRKKVSTKKKVVAKKKLHSNQ